MVNYGAAIKKPFEDITTLVIGIIIGIIPVVGLLNTGYGILTAKNVLAGDKKLMKWDAGKIVDMIVAIIMVVIIGFVYMIPALILIVIGAAALIGAIIANPSDIGAAIMGSVATGGVVIIGGILLAIIADLLLPMAIMNYAKTGSIGAAFDFGTVLKKVLRVKYLISLIVMILYAVVLSVVALILAIIPVVGTLIGLGLMSFLGTVTSFTILAETYAE